MAKSKSLDFGKTPAEIARTGWLAYLGLYRLAYERAAPAVETAAERSADFVKTLIAKGELVEADAKEQLSGMRVRAKEAYAAGVEQVRAIAPAAADRLPVVEVKVSTKKSATKTRAAVSRKRSTKKTAAKKAA